MKNNLYKLPVNQTLLDVLETYEEHLENNEMVIQLNDGLCKIHLDPKTKKYQVLVDHFDITVNSSIEAFLYKD